MPDILNMAATKFKMAATLHKRNLNVYIGNFCHYRWSTPFLNLMAAMFNMPGKNWALTNFCPCLSLCTRSSFSFYSVCRANKHTRNLRLLLKLASRLFAHLCLSNPFSKHWSAFEVDPSLLEILWECRRVIKESNLWCFFVSVNHKHYVWDI